MKKIFVFSPMLIFPLKQGNRIRLYQTLKKFIENGYEVTFFCNNLEDGGVIDELQVAQHNKFLTKFIYAKYEGNHFKTLSRGIQSESDVWDSSIEDRIKKEVEGKFFNACLTNYSLFTKVFDFFPSGTHKIVEMHDRLGDRARLVNSNGVVSDFFSTTVDREIKYLQRSDTVVCIKDTEAEYLIENGFTKNAITGYCPLEDKDPFTLTENYLFKNKSIGFIGSDNRVNRQCVASIYKALAHNFQLCRSKKIIFKIGGKISSYAESIIPAELSKFVKIHGEIEDLADFYKSISLLVNPTTFSTGFKLKNVESFSYGVPLVSSIDASDGIPNRPSFLLNTSPQKTVECAIHHLSNESAYRSIYIAMTKLKDQYKKIETESWKKLFELIGHRKVFLNIDQQFDDRSNLLICQLLGDYIRATDQLYISDKLSSSLIFQYLKEKKYQIFRTKVYDLDEIDFTLSINTSNAEKSRFQIGRSSITLTINIKDKIYVHTSVSTVATNGSTNVRNWIKPFYFQQNSSYTSKKILIYFKTGNELLDKEMLSAASKVGIEHVPIDVDTSVKSILLVLSNLDCKYILVDFSDSSHHSVIRNYFYSFHEPILLTNRLDNINLFKRIQGPEIQFINIEEEIDAGQIIGDLANSNKAYSKLMLWSPYRAFAGY